MIDHHTHTISAFVDGEPVDADHLAAALEDPDARATLVDFVRMRAAVRAGDSPLPASLNRFRKPPMVTVRLLRWPAVAALLVLVFLAGLLAPRPSTSGPGVDFGDPPRPTRVEKFTPGVDWYQSN
jgi:hypothetical protein